MPYKQVILVRQDLKLPKGKLSVQVAHASVECVLKTNRRLVDAWRKEGGKKVVLKVADKKQLLHFKKLADSSNLKNAIITDAGKTTINIHALKNMCVVKNKRLLQGLLPSNIYPGSIITS